MLQCLFFNKHNSFHAVLIFPLTLRKLIQRHFCSTRNIKSTQHTALNLTARQFNETPKLNCYNWKRNCGMKLPQCFSFRAEKKKTIKRNEKRLEWRAKKKCKPKFFKKKLFWSFAFWTKQGLTTNLIQLRRQDCNVKQTSRHRIDNN